MLTTHLKMHFLNLQLSRTNAQVCLSNGNQPNSILQDALILYLVEIRTVPSVEMRVNSLAVRRSWAFDSRSFTINVSYIKNSYFGNEN